MLTTLPQLLHDESDDQDADASGARVTDVQLLMNAPSTSPDEFYQTVTVNALVNVLADPTLTNNHWSATEAVMLIFTTQGLKCVPYLGQVSAICDCLDLHTNASPS
jgi:FKBP12-rapamycin complex-associated protein